METPFATPQSSPPEGDPRSIWVGWPRRRILALILLVLVSDFTVQLVCLGLGAGGFAAVLCGAVVGVMVPLGMMAGRTGAVFVRDLGIDRPPPGEILAAAVMAVAALLPVSLLAQLSLRLTPPGEDWVRQAQADLPRTGAAIALAAVTVVVFVPVVEEIIFRGLLQRLVGRFIGPGQAVIYAAVLFAVAHLQPWLFLGLVGVGLVLGFIFRATGSVTVCAAAHAVHNAFSLAIMVRGGEGNYEPSAPTTTEVGLTVLSLAVLLGAGRWLWARRRRA